jgi:pentapeptide repeat protein
MASDGESPPPAAGAEKPEPVRDKTWADRAQLIVAVATVAAVFVTIVVACQGQQAVNHNSQVTMRQSLDTQLSTAITAIGSSDTAEEIAGLLLLTQNTQSRFSLMNQTGEPSADVFSDYTTALQILSGYLSSRGEQYLTGYTDQATAPFGRGYGMPASPGIPLDIFYAADQVNVLFGSGMQKTVTSLGLGEQPRIDLSNDELQGQPWTGINFGWIQGYLFGIDLRGAYLERSHWSASSDLSHAYLQCADLQGADFAGANLSYADLAGADIQGANFRGANLEGATLRPVYGAATWSQPPAGLSVHSVSRWDQAACLQSHQYWRNAPAPGAGPSPGPTASASPKPSVTQSPKPTVTATK